MKRKVQTISIEHLSMLEGRQLLKGMDFAELGIPSISAVLDTRWRAEYKGKFLDPKDNALFLDEVLRIVRGLSDVTTQRSVYYALRGAHPEWTYKGEPLGAAFYEHLTMWIMEKAQLKTGITMQAMGIWAGIRGYVTGDGIIQSGRRGRVPLSARPAMAFDLADEGVILATRARKLIHFEKEAGLEGLLSGNFPQFTEALFSTSGGALTESSTKFMRMLEDRGMPLWAVHDGDPAGMQMQLMHGMASQNNCYMPEEFYPQFVRPLGFYPSIGYALGLPPEDVTDKEDKIFNNLINLVNEKNERFPELRRYGLDQEVDVIVNQRKKWEFQALDALHETAPKIFILEGLRVHGDEIKHVPGGDVIKRQAMESARIHATTEVENSLKKLANELYSSELEKKLIDLIRASLSTEIAIFRQLVEDALELLEAAPDEAFREAIKKKILSDPSLYAADIVKKMGKEILMANFIPTAELETEFSISGVSAQQSVVGRPPSLPEHELTKTELVNAIEKKILPDSATRSKITGLLRSTLEQRFGEPEEVW